MDKYLPVLGCGLALLLSVFAYAQYSDLQQVRGDLLAVKRLQDLQAEIFAEDMEELEQTIADLRNRLRGARQDLALAREEIRDQQDQFGQNTLAYNSSIAEPRSRERPITRILNLPRMQEISSRMMLNSSYGRFIDSLNLNADERDQLSEIMTDVIGRQNELRILLGTGEISREDFQFEMAEISMEDALADFLTPGEMDSYYTYQEQEAERNRQQAEAAMNMQLTAQTPGLTEENRNTLARILSQELGRSGTGGRFGAGMVMADIRADSGDSGESSFRFQAQGFATQPEVYENILQQLEGTMEDDQLDIVEGYLEQQQMQVEMIQEIMSMQDEGGERQGFFITR